MLDHLHLVTLHTGRVFVVGVEGLFVRLLRGAVVRIYLSPHWNIEGCVQQCTSLTHLELSFRCARRSGLVCKESHPHRLRKGRLQGSGVRGL